MPSLNTVVGRRPHDEPIDDFISAGSGGGGTVTFNERQPFQAEKKKQACVYICESSLCFVGLLFFFSLSRGKLSPVLSQHFRW